MKIVTGFRGENHITSNDDQGRNQGIFGTASYVLQVGSMFAATLASSNELQIADGEGMMQGVHFRTAPGEQNSVTIDNGTQGMKRIDLVAAHYAKNEETSVESVEWIVYKGTPAASSPAMPSYVTGDILQGATAADMPMYAVHLDGITVESVEQLFTTERGIASVLELLGNTGIGSIGDGTVTGAISALNSDLANITNRTSATLGSGLSGTAYYTRVGNIVVVTGTITSSDTIAQGATLASGFPRPATGTNFPIHMANNNAVASIFRSYITANGVLMCAENTVSNVSLRFSAAYIAS